MREGYVGFDPASDLFFSFSLSLPQHLTSYKDLALVGFASLVVFCFFVLYNVKMFVGLAVLVKLSVIPPIHTQPKFKAKFIFAVC